MNVPYRGPLFVPLILFERVRNSPKLSRDGPYSRLAGYFEKILDYGLPTPV